MPVARRRPDNHPNRHGRSGVIALLALLIASALLVGCGSSSSSSRPAYCDPVTKTENAVKSLPSAEDVKKNGVGTLKSALSKLEQNARAAVTQAKSDFASETTALKNSVNALSSTAKQLFSSPSVQTLAQLPAELSAVSAAAKNLQSAASSKCG